MVLEIDVVRSVGTRAAARLARSRASAVRAIFGWMLLWVKMLRRLTATQLVVRVVGNECGEFVDVAGGPRDACEVGVRHPRCALELVCSSVSLHARG